MPGGTKGLFSKGREARCAWCVHGREASDAELRLCPFKGVVDACFRCRRFRYDPLKREPKPAPTLPDFDAKDFSLQ